MAVGRVIVYHVVYGVISVSSFASVSALDHWVLNIYRCGIMMATASCSYSGSSHNCNIPKLAAPPKKASGGLFSRFSRFKKCTEQPIILAAYIHSPSVNRRGVRDDTTRPSRATQSLRHLPVRSSSSSMAEMSSIAPNPASKEAAVDTCDQCRARKVCRHAALGLS